MFNLLNHSFVPVVSNGHQMAVTLPALFSRLADDEIDSFPGLAAHQTQAWYQFLAQLGAIALHRAGRDRLSGDPEQWRMLLLSLAPECAWCLAVDEPTEPALLQPPTDRIDTFTRSVETPDALDVLVTAKNHDRKRTQAVSGPPHLWLYALVTLQTTQGFSGRGNPGIARMNGGFSSRVLVDRRPGSRWGPRLDRAIRMLLTCRPELRRRLPDELYRFDGRGLALLWLRSWDTDVPLRLAALDPFFIEVCRRLRLTAATEDGRITAVVRPANVPRVEAQAWKGNLGDPWVPINRDGAAALTVSGNGFDYRLAQRILFGQSMTRPVALKPLPGEENEDSQIHMMVLVRGQGKTQGLHERVIPMPSQIAAQLALGEDDADPIPLAELSEEMVELAGETRKVLRQAVLIYLQGPDAPNFQKPDAASTVARYDRSVDAEFFRRLFAVPQLGAQRVHEAWQRFLRDEAVRLAESTWNRMTPPSTRREKARAASEAVLFGGLRKRLPDAFPKSDAQEVSA